MTDIPCEWHNDTVLLGEESTRWAVFHYAHRVDPKKKSLGSFYDLKEQAARVRVVCKWLHIRGWVALPWASDTKFSVYLSNDRKLTLLLLTLTQQHIQYLETMPMQFGVPFGDSVYRSLVNNKLIQRSSYAS